MNAPRADVEHDEFMRLFVLRIAQTLVDDQVSIVVEIVPSEAYSTLRVQASDGAVSVLIGAKGQMARALPTLVAGTSAKLGRRYALDLVDSMISPS